jgi:hypothetical protein
VVRPLHARGAALIGLTLIVGAAATARGDFITTLTVVQDTAPDGLFRYTYTLSNDAASTQTVNLFQLDVAPDANLQAITNTVDWDVTYASGASTIIWTSAFLPDFTTNDLDPGTTGLFSFESAFGPDDLPFLIGGRDPTGGLGATSEGFILSPAAVPEPMGLALLAIGASVLLIAGRAGLQGPPAPG